MTDVGVNLDGFFMALGLGAAAIVLLVWLLILRDVSKRPSRAGSPILYFVAWALPVGVVAWWSDMQVRYYVREPFVLSLVACGLGLGLAIAASRQRSTFDAAQRAMRG